MSNSVDKATFVMEISKYLDFAGVAMVKSAIEKLSDEQIRVLNLNLKNLKLVSPVQNWWLNLFLGIFGLARFMAGSIILGYVYLSCTIVGFFTGITFIIPFIGTFIDMFVIMNVTRKHNLEKIMKAI